MAPLTPAQHARRARIEGLIALAAPVLDLVLAVGDRVSRIVGPDDEPLPIRPASERVELGAARPGEPSVASESSSAPGD
jgi:hypothetical protein